MLLPVFREQLDEGQQVDGGFKDQQLFVGATMGKAKRLFCTGCMDDVQKFERAENFLHVYSSKETEESYTVRCSIIQPGQQSLFDNEHTVYETVKVGEADGVLGTSTDEHGKNVYTLSWEHRGITHTVMGNIPYDEIMKIAEGIR